MFFGNALNGFSFCFQYLSSMVLSQADVMDTFNGIQFLPLDKNTYLRVQCFINQLEAVISEIAYSVLVFNDQLVWYVLTVVYKLITVFV